MTVNLDAAAWFVLVTSLRALAAAAAVALVLRVLRVRAADVLHSAWSAVLFAMLLMPVLPTVVPAVPLPLPAAAGSLLDIEADGSAATASRESGGRAAITTPTGSARIAEAHSVSEPAASSAPPERRAGSRLWLTLFGLYAAGVGLLTVRLFRGWLLASAVMRRAQAQGPIDVGVRAPVYESSEVRAPMTVGAICPIVLLPLAWRTWNAETLAAIVAHEAAHVRRHDSTIALAAHINRTLFWFHPLAWWLERKLSLTAEHACDEAAVRVIGAPVRYAEILVAMAKGITRGGGRLLPHAVGVNARQLDSRIDRLLRPDPFARPSVAAKLATAIACSVAILAVVACGQRLAAVPLREDPELAKRIADQSQRTKRFESARDMSEEQAEALERRLAVNPGDFDARWQLVTYYTASSNVPWTKKVPGLRRHSLWLIEHHPEHEVVAPPLSPQFDPEGFAAATKLWERHLEKPDVSVYTVYRAASFFAPYDKPAAERLMLRGMQMDPASTALAARMRPDAGGYEWPSQLAALYAATLRGSESVAGTYNDLRTHLDKLNSPFARDVRARLEATADATLLARVGSRLVRPGPTFRDAPARHALEEVRALGVRYLERALEIDPNLELAKATLVRLRLHERSTDADRLANRAAETFMMAEDITEYAKKDMARAKQQRDEATARAKEALTLAERRRGDPAYSAAVMTAHHVLAAAALRDGDRRRALRHMRESVKVPPSEALEYAPPLSWMRPVNRLLKEGEREAVAEFLEAFARLTSSGRDRLLEDARAIREGRMPVSYQHTVARGGP